MPSGRTRSKVRHGAVTIDVIREGAGPLVVLLPSKARDSLDFDEVAAGLARRGMRVLRPQPRGAFESVGPLEGIRLHDLAADAAQVIAEDGAGPAIVVGHAFGNWVARMLAVTHPALVRGVVLAAAAARRVSPEIAATVAIASDMNGDRNGRLAALRLGFFAPGNDPTPWLDGWHADANRAQTAATAATPRSEFWHAGSAPILEIIPEHDPFKPRASWDETRAELGSRVATIRVADASHALFPEQPGAVIEAIAAFSAGVDGHSG